VERPIFGLFLPYMEPLKVLVLTDFSPLSKVALQYAVRISAKLPCELTILNVVRLDGVPRSSMRLKQVEQMLTKIAQEEGEKLIAEVKGKTKAPLSFLAVKGHTVTDVVRRYISKNYMNLIVMGSQGASQLKKLSLGGTTVAAIDAITTPVMAIPKYAEFHDFGRIVYATDLKNLKAELDLIIPFASIFNTHVHIVHVVENVNKQVDEKRIEAEQIIAKTGYKKMDFRLIIDDDIPEAIDGFIRQSKADLLTTFTHELKLYEKLFGLSVTRQLAYQGNIPLLAFKRK
jgi:nucleotide-binding universal stress UspA family protein